MRSENGDLGDAEVALKKAMELDPKNERTRVNYDALQSMIAQRRQSSQRTDGLATGSDVTVPQQATQPLQSPPPAVACDKLWQLAERPEEPVRFAPSQSPFMHAFLVIWSQSKIERRVVPSTRSLEYPN